MQSDEVAFRVRFRGQIPSQNMLYWRGPVLWRFYGREWRGYEERIGQEIPFMPIGNPTDYTVTMEPSGEHWLLALSVPLRYSPGCWHHRFISTELRPETCQWAIAICRALVWAGAKPANDRWEHRLGLQAAISVCARELAQSGGICGTDDGAIVAAGLRYIREQPFVYTLQPPLLRAMWWTSSVRKPGADSANTTLAVSLS
ncbi:MAG: DUF3488 domain-containing protein [Gammaproteobacteria bacterium]